MSTEKEEHEYPNIVERFHEVFQKLGIKKADAYVDHCAKGDLENLEDVEEKLYDMGLHPSLRNQVVNFWAAEIKQPIPQKLQKRLAEERGAKVREGEREPEAKYGVDTETGSIKVASTSDKAALTWDEAQKLSKTIKKEQPGRDESPFIQDGNGNWQLNPKARVTGIELLAFDSIKRAQERGEPVDPLEALAQTTEKLKIYQEVLSGGKAPAWTTDPVEFIKAIRTISPEPKGDEGLKEQIAALASTVNELKEEKYRDQITTQQQQIQTLTNKVGELVDTVTELRRPVTGRTEMDIIHDVATGVLDEVKGTRGDIKGYFMSHELPAPKTPEQREARKARFREAVETDRRLEILGRRVFFGENIPEAPKPIPKAPQKEAESEDEALARRKFPNMGPGFQI